MSRTTIAAAVAAGLLATASSAQASPFEFGGFYAGGHFGYQESTADFESLSFGRGGGDDQFEKTLSVQSEAIIVGSDGGGNLTDSGLTGGLHMGFNIMQGNIMFGVETDVSLTSASPDGSCPNASFADCEVDVGPMASLRPRVGFATGDILFFVTGGVAAARFDVEVSGEGSSETEQGVFGWAAGAGVEYLLGDMMGVSLEYRFQRFGDFDKIRAPSGAKIDVEMHSIQGGVNWYF